MLIRSKSTPSNSPRAERSHSQRQLARSEPGAAMRATMVAMASARCVPLKPSRSSRASRPSCSMAHSPTFSTPTERGRINSRELTSTVCKVGALDCGGQCAIEELRGDALGIPLHLLRTGQRHQFALALEQLLDPGAQHGPVPSLEREVAAEVEQGVLADPVSAALVAHEAVRVIDVTAFGCAYLGAPDEHGRRITAGPAFDNP